MAVWADMPHGNSCGVLNLNAIDPVCISKEGHCDGPSFDVRTISVTCILRQIQSFLSNMSLRAD